MNRPLLRTAVIAALVIAAALGIWAVVRARNVPEAAGSVRATRSDIVRSVRASGSIAPRIEVAVKPQVSGVIERLAVEPGDAVRVGDLLAVVRPLPDAGEVNEARRELDTARLDHARAVRDRDRGEELTRHRIVSDDGIDRLRTAVAIAQVRVEAAERALLIARSGTDGGEGQPPTEVRATIAGTVLERPVEVGGFVIETNTFNEGSTIAVIADMADLVFTGRVDEAEAGRLRHGMEVAIAIGALPEHPVAGTLEFIAPRASEHDHLAVFRIRAGLKVPGDVALRAGYSATGSIATDRRTAVLAIQERWLRFADGGTPWVAVATADGGEARRDVRLGLSDGVLTEVLDGLAEADAVIPP